MYEAWWALKENPFRAPGHDRAGFAARGHEEAQARMLYALRGGRGMMVLTGRTGCGVTTAVERFARTCDGRVVRGPARDAGEALEVIAGAVEAPAGGRLFDAVSRTVAGMASPVILWDDAPLAAPEALEVLRLLCDIPCAGDTRLTAILAGELCLEDLVRRTPGLAGRVELAFRLHGLEEDELRPYVEGRLWTAGASRPIFAGEAFGSLGFHAGGNVRRVNALCEGALLLGAMAKAPEVTAEIVRQAASELERG